MKNLHGHHPRSRVMKKKQNHSKKILKRNQSCDQASFLESLNPFRCVRCSPTTKNPVQVDFPPFSKLSPPSKRSNLRNNRKYPPAIVTPTISPELEAASSFKIPPDLLLPAIDKSQITTPRLSLRSFTEKEENPSYRNSLFLSKPAYANISKSLPKAFSSQDKLKFSHYDEYHLNLTTARTNNEFIDKMNRLIDLGLSQGMDLLSTLEISRGIPKYCTEAFLSGDINHVVTKKIHERTEKALREWMETQIGG